jgi:hypothetical protein
MSLEANKDDAVFFRPTIWLSAIEGTQLANTDEVVNYINISKHGDFPLITLTSHSFWLPTIIILVPQAAINLGMVFSSARFLARDSKFLSGEKKNKCFPNFQITTDDFTCRLKLCRSGPDCVPLIIYVYSL